MITHKGDPTAGSSTDQPFIATMDKIVIYFHGFGSSVNTDKVDRLVEGLPSDVQVIALPIDPDPRVSIPSLEHDIDMLLATNLHRGVRIVFVGTSLGAWYASKLGAKYDIPAVLINPCYAPKQMLAKHGLSPDVLDAYSEPMEFREKNIYFVTIDDEVINFAPVMHTLQSVDTNFYRGTGHRFNGPEFDDVVDAVRHLM